MIDFWCGDGFYDKLPSRIKAFLNAAISKNAEDVRASFAETIGATALEFFDRPAMIAFGDLSPKIAAMIAASLKKLLPRAVVAPIRGATHLSPDSHAEDVARLIGMAVSESGVARPMKMGTTASPWRYDARARCARVVPQIFDALRYCTPAG
jgi:hypothetical protein